MESRFIALGIKIEPLQRLCVWAMLDLDYFTFQENTRLWWLSPSLILKVSAMFWAAKHVHFLRQFLFFSGATKSRISSVSMTYLNWLTMEQAENDFVRKTSPSAALVTKKNHFISPESFFLQTERIYLQTTSWTDPRLTRGCLLSSVTAGAGSSQLREDYLRQYSTSIWQADATLVISSHSNLESFDGVEIGVCITLQEIDLSVSAELPKTSPHTRAAGNLSTCQSAIIQFHSDSAPKGQ